MTVSFGVSTAQKRNCSHSRFSIDTRHTKVLTQRQKEYLAPRDRHRIDPTTGLLKRRVRFRGTRTPVELWKQIVLRDPCPYCLKRRSTTIDHIIPRSKGGSNYWQNMTGACEECNHERDNTSLLLWIYSRK